MKTCTIEGCYNNVKARGLCPKHYARFRIHGDPLAGGRWLAPRGALSEWINKHKSYSGEECLFWPFYCDSDGYARAGQGKSVSRLMCEEMFGPAPSPTDHAAHSCGNGHLGCVNPRHLRWATPKSNAADKAAHGTVLKHERHNLAKLTKSQVDEIRRMRGIVPQWRIGKMFGVSQTNVSSILRGETWV